jgi:hypothetical protein
MHASWWRVLVTVPAPRVGGAPCPHAGARMLVTPRAGGAPCPHAGGAPCPHAGGAPCPLLLPAVVRPPTPRLVSYPSAYAVLYKFKPHNQEKRFFSDCMPIFHFSFAPFEMFLNEALHYARTCKVLHL